MSYLKHCNEALLVNNLKLRPLLVILIILPTNNVEELQAVLALAGADHPQPIPQLLLLKELLREILEVPSAELLVRDDLDPAIAQIRDVNIVAEVAGAAVDFDALLEERREGGWVEDAVLRWLGCVDDELNRIVSNVSTSKV